MQPLIGYRVATTAPEPDVRQGQLYDYVLAGNGLFLDAARAGLSVLVPVQRLPVRGLAMLRPAVDLCYPRVPNGVLGLMLRLARESRVGRGPAEILFHLRFDLAHGRWHLSVPPQERSAGHVRPLESGPDSSFAQALIEVHSHHGMGAFWSATDNADESAGFRLFGVLGNIFKQPAFRLRVGVHGYFHEVAPATIFEVPPGWLVAEEVPGGPIPD